MFDPGLARRVGSRRNAEAFRNVGKKSSHFMPPSSFPSPNEIMILAMERDGKNPRKREAKLSRIPIWPTRTAAMTPHISSTNINESFVFSRSASLCFPY